MLFAVVDAVGWLTFSVARAVGRLARRAVPGRSRVRSCRSDDPRTILVIQLDHLGDAVISTVMFPALRSRYPHASIEVLAGPWNREVFEAVAEVDRVDVCRVNRFARKARLGWILSTVWWGIRLRRRRVDLGIDVRGEFPHAVILWLCGARRRLGWASGGGGFLLTDAPPFIADRPEVESRLALLAELGIRFDEAGEAPRPALHPPDDGRRRMARRLTELRRGRAEPAAVPRIVLHVGAGMPAKRWPVEHWRELVRRLHDRLRAEVVLVGGADDRTIARAIMGPRSRGRVADWTGRLRVVELAALLEQSDLFVGADSGPAHVAAAVGTPSVVLFSGTNRTGQWRPRGEHVAILRHAVACSPCHRRVCPLGEHPCMRGLAPSRVAEAVEEAIEEAGSRRDGNDGKGGIGSRKGAKAQRKGWRRENEDSEAGIHSGKLTADG